jgi:hypothetical protein
MDGIDANVLECGDPAAAGPRSNRGHVRALQSEAGFAFYVHWLLATKVPVDFSSEFYAESIRLE